MSLIIALLVFVSLQSPVIGFDCLHCSSPESKVHLQGQPLTDYFKTGPFGDELPPAHKDCMENPNNLEIKRIPCSTRCLQIYFNGSIHLNPEGGFKRVFVRHCADEFIWGGVPCMNAPCCGVMNKTVFGPAINIRLSGRGCTCASENVCNTLTPDQMDSAVVCPNVCSEEGTCPAERKCSDSPDALGFKCDGKPPEEQKSCGIQWESTTETTTIALTTDFDTTTSSVHHVTSETGHVTSETGHVTSQTGHATSETTEIMRTTTTMDPNGAKTSASSSISLLLITAFCIIYS